MFTARELSNKDLSWINEKQYFLVRDAQTLGRMTEHIHSVSTAPSIDLETEGLSPFAHNIVGLGFSPEPEWAYYIPIRHRYIDNAPFTDLREAVLKLIGDFSWVVFNGMFEWKFIKHFYGLNLKIDRDVQADMYLLDSDRGPMNRRTRLKLEFLSKEFLGVDQLSLDDVLDKGVKDFSLVRYDEDALLYGGGDVDCTLRLERIICRDKIQRWKLGQVSKIERGVIVPAAKMELNGIPLDDEYAKSVDLSSTLLNLRTRIEESTGSSINPASPSQVASLLFDTLGLSSPKKDSKSVDDSVLSRLKDDHPVIKVIQEYREVDKLNSAFLEKMQHVAAEDGRLHGGLIPTGTRSGRFSHSGGQGLGGVDLKINVAQLPKTKKKSRVNIRKILRATEGWTWYYADFSQVEYRTVAYISGEPILIKCYAEGGDYHAIVASVFLNIPAHLITPEQRDDGKTLNFSVVYGKTDAGLAMSLKCSIQEAAAKLKAYFERLPRVRRLVDDTKSFTRRNGFVRTEFGRIRHFDFEGAQQKRVEALLRAAFNTRIQGTAADLNKIALIRFDRILTKEYGDRARLLSTVHDEVNLEASNEIPVGEMLAFIKENMSLPAGLKPGWGDFPADVAVGPSYGELIDVKPEYFDLLKTLDDVGGIVEEEEKVDEELASQLDAKPVVYRKCKIEAPAIVVNLGESPNERAVEDLSSLIGDSFGNYRLFFKNGERFFCCDSFTVNPSPSFLESLTVLGFSVEKIYKREDTIFDVSKLTF